jgi:thioesterase domain-containing protein
VIALEIARQLEEAGECVVLVALLDARGVLLPAMKPARRRWVRAVRFAGKTWFQLSRPGRLRRIKAGIAARATHVAEMLRRTQPDGHPAAENAALRQYRPHPLATGRGAGRILHLWASERPRGPFLDPAFEWGHLSPGGFEFHEVPGGHFSMLHEPNVSEVARILARELDRVPVTANR